MYVYSDAEDEDDDNDGLLDNEDDDDDGDGIPDDEVQQIDSLSDTYIHIEIIDEDRQRQRDRVFFMKLQKNLHYLKQIWYFLISMACLFQIRLFLVY